MPLLSAEACLPRQGLPRLPPELWQEEILPPPEPPMPPRAQQRRRRAEAAVRPKGLNKAAQEIDDAANASPGK